MDNKSTASSHGRLIRRKQQLWTTSLIIILCCIVSGITLSFVFTQTEPLKNTFTPSKVSCDVLESFDGETKSDVRIKNTGKTSAYIRAAVVVTWMSEDASQVSALKPLAGTDYEIIYGADGWELGADGFWYHKLPVAPEAETSLLIESCSCSITPPEGFRLSVEIVASSLQSSPTDVVTEHWSSGVSGIDGTSLQIIK